MIDFNLVKGDPTVNEEEALILQQVELLFDTYPKEVLGAEDFGTNYQEFLYDQNMSNEYIRGRILSDLGKLELFDYSVDVHVSLLEGSNNDILLAEIIFYHGSYSFKKIFKITQ